MTPHIVILGAGPAGLGAANRLKRTHNFHVTVLEKNDSVGGNAGSFEIDGITVDFGSHRLHPSCDPQVLSDLKRILGDDLLIRPRHGRILLKDKWIHFPLKPFDLFFHLPVNFAWGVLNDVIRKTIGIRSTDASEVSFASVMEAGLGATICRDFYFPYARKIWGIEPEELSAVQALRRVSAGSLSKMARKVLAAVPGFRPPMSGRFYYPHKGFGQISKALSDSAQAAGVTVNLSSQIVAIRHLPNAEYMVQYKRSEELTEIHASQIWSTIPITSLARIVQPAPPETILQAAREIDYRAMLLIYLTLEQTQFSAYDAHYLPTSEIPVTRISEPKNYSGITVPDNRTVLCAELPCSPEDEWWTMSDSALGELVNQALAVAGIPVKSVIRSVTVRRLRYAYPIYRKFYEKHFQALDDWVGGQPGLLSFGRQGLFAHDNTHHALYMAYCAVECLDQAGQFDSQKWQQFRKLFDTHVVED